MENPNNPGYAGLYARIDQIQPHPEALKSDIIKKSTIVDIPKNNFIVSPGETSQHYYFIIDGFVRIYREHGKKEVTNWFLYNNDFMIQLHGCYFGQKSPEYHQATENTKCIKLHIDDLKWLFKKYPLFKDTYTKLTEIYYFQLSERDVWKVYKAKEKYQMLLKEYPYIIQKAQSAHIASYFGISEFHYSKIKNGRL